ncbi:hypothetical protein BD779DRAFT_1678816 [Infundibulicybe gibba]|nr:hypothetical protein BD779DRAFT_1678816 [Infundibulicybe gibba]
MSLSNLPDWLVDSLVKLIGLFNPLLKFHAAIPYLSVKKQPLHEDGDWVMSCSINPLSLRQPTGTWFPRKPLLKTLKEISPNPACASFSKHELGPPGEKPRSDSQQRIKPIPFMNTSHAQGNATIANGRMTDDALHGNC